MVAQFKTTTGEMDDRAVFLMCMKCQENLVTAEFTYIAIIE